MTISVKHPAVVGRKITPADYAAEHELTLSAAGLLGSTAAGAVGRIPIGSGLSFSGGNLIATGGGGGSGESVWVSVADYLDPARVPNVTDDLPAFQAALAAIAAATAGNQGLIPGAWTGSTRLLIPAGFYYLSGPLVCVDPIQIQGAGSAQSTGGSATIIRFAKNCNGIDLRGSGSSLEGVQLWGGNVNAHATTGAVTSYNAGDSTTGNGVIIGHDFIACKDVASYFFGGDGFYGVADGVAQANSFYLERCISQFNRGRGYYIAGTDANAGVMICCSALENGGAGFLDYSFLGNTYIQGHVRDCGVDDPTTGGTGTGGPTGTCLYSGVYYYVVAGQEIAASTTTPGTNNAVWRVFAGHPSCKTWVSGMTWVNPSPYGTNPANVNARNVFLGCYAESAQPPCQITYPSLILGGLLDEVTVDGSAPWMQAANNVIVGPGFKTVDPDFGVKYTILGGAGGLWSSDTALAHYDGTDTFRIRSTAFAARTTFGFNGGASFDVTTNGIDLSDAKALYANGAQVVGARGAAVADATGGGTVDTEARAAINALLARCRAHGLIGT